MDLNVVHGFLAIAEEGSMGKAARRLHVSQSTLTRQIQALESEVGGVLFERSERGVALTPAGRVFREGVRPHVEAIGRVVHEARRTARGQDGTLRIGYIASAARAYLNPALRVLRNKGPALKVKLFDLTPTEQFAGLRNGTLDLVLLGLQHAVHSARILRAETGHCARGRGGARQPSTRQADESIAA